MLRIAICDDMKNELQNLVLMTNQFITANSLDAEISEFSHPDVLLLAIQTENFNLYILDIVMPMINGLELGKEIRRLDREAQIIFTTTEPQFALQAYSANPINYLIKPIEKQQFFETLTLAVSKSKLVEDQTFTVKTSNSLRVIKLSDIVYCEYQSHRVIFNLLRGDEIISSTIRDNFLEYCTPILKDKHFIKCHTSFVINMRRVERFSKESFTMRGGNIVPIATKQYSVVRDQYMDYITAKEGQR